VSIWNDYWLRYQTSDEDLAMYEYRKLLLAELTTELEPRCGKEVNLLNAGCGIDPMPLHLLPKFPNLRFCLLDISPQCLNINRRLAEQQLAPAELARLSFAEGDVFDLKYDAGSYDIVYHTGVLEHFLEPDRVRILTQVERVLKPGGAYITLNPCSRGLLYVWMKGYWSRKGRWPYGPEYPIRSLRTAVKAAFRRYRLTERNLDFRQTAMMLEKHDRRLFSRIGGKLLAASSLRLFGFRILEGLLLKTLGGYILLTKVHKPEAGTKHKDTKTPRTKN
jgi:ubiquinone/menaquinone biosynthesis C-methylase UbiE